MAAARRRYLFRSREEAEEAYTRSEGFRTLNDLALNDVVRGDVVWFERGRYRAGVTRPASPTGGIVVIVYCTEGQRPSTAARYVDDFCDEWRKWIPPTAHAGDEYRDEYALRQLAQEVLVYRNTQAGY